MIKVAICGCKGKMGTAVSHAVNAACDMEFVCGIAETAELDGEVPVYDDVEAALDAHDVDVFVDFTQPAAIEQTLRRVLPRGIDCVVGTTGLADEKLAELAGLAPEGTCLFYAPNFTTGAVLMMQFAEIAAQYFSEAEVIEAHHAAKKDAPSGTAIKTARRIACNRPAEYAAKDEGFASRGLLVDGVPVHSLRSNGFVANQEVVFGDFGQTLSIKHESWDRQSYMPGVLLGIRRVGGAEGLVVGLENFM